MAVYQYKAVREGGETVRGTLDADSARGARARLRSHGLYVTEVRRVGAVRAADLLRRLVPFRRNRQSRLVWFTRELHLLVTTGVPLREALAALARSAPAGLKSVVRALRDDITRGESLSTALSRHPDWFNGIYVSMVQAGERSGQLAALLGNLSRYLQDQENFRRQVRTALIYPKLVGLATLGVVVFLMSTVVPRLVEVIVRRGGELPWPTAVLRHVSGFFAAYWGWCLAGALALWGVWQIVSARPAVRAAWERVLLRLPGVGGLRRKWAAQQFAVMLGALLRGGVVLPDALAQLAETSASPLMARTAERMRERIVQGGSLTAASEGLRVFPTSFGEVLSAGQEAGSLEAVLEQVARSYGQELEHATRTVAAIVEPAAILVVALVVGFVVAAVLLPVFELGQIQ
ncbi:MAG: type II secretion system F family protein [Ectothiorhodospiraceae bacterium]